jgi:hypothetical protein
MTTLTDRLARVRRPEYTGANRCLPCTVVNLTLAAGLTGATALVSPPAAVGVAGLSLASIYLRGYLVPGTPELTKRYLPERVLAWFGKAPEAPVVHATDIDPGAVLAEAGVLVDDPGLDDVALDAAFRAAWEARTAALLADDDSERRALARLLEVPHEDLTVASHGAGLAAYLDGEWLGVWESPAAFFTDMAALELLADRVDDWARLGMDARSELAGALRLFVETCPACGGHVSFGEDTVDSCCSTYEVVAVTCDDCGTRLLELNASPDRFADAAAGVETA